MRLLVDKVQLGRRTIQLSHHARERYGERSGQHTAQQMQRDLQGARWSRQVPGWARLSLWHRARAEGIIELDENRCFVVNRNWSTGGDLVAVSYIERDEHRAKGGSPTPNPTARATTEVP